MKKLIIVLSVFLAVSIGASAQKIIKKEESKIIFICPTHPDVINSDQGKCPKCGMVMTKTTEKVPTYALKGCQPTTKTVTKYVCPMDGSTSDNPGKCSKCAMKMVEITEKVPTYALKGSQPMAKTVTKFVCPIDGTISDTKGECPKCGMDMTKKEPEIK